MTFGKCSALSHAPNIQALRFLQSKCSGQHLVRSAGVDGIKIGSEGEDVNLERPDNHCKVTYDFLTIVQEKDLE